MTSPGPPTGLREAAVRRCLLAVTVVHDLDLSWGERARDGFSIEATSPIPVSADRLASVIGQDDPEDTATVERLAGWVRLRRAVHVLPEPILLGALRAVGLPSGHVRHPGPGWARQRIPGGALVLGLGLLPDASEASGLNAPTPVALPDGVLEDEGVDAAAAWPAAMRRLEDLGEVAAARHRRRPKDPLRPLAEADVVTLLGSATFRMALATCTATGLVGLVVPMLSRGWISSSAIDPAFGPAAAAATDAKSRGFHRPLLVTRDEVVQVPAGGHPLRYLGEQKPRSPLS
jgi:hypothetical protein